MVNLYFRNIVSCKHPKQEASSWLKTFSTVYTTAEQSCTEMIFTLTGREREREVMRWKLAKNKKWIKVETWGCVKRTREEGRHRRLSRANVANMSTLLHKSLFRNFNSFQLVAASVGRTSQPVESTRWKTTQDFLKKYFVWMTHQTSVWTTTQHSVKLTKNKPKAKSH